MSHSIKAGVATGKEVQEIFKLAKQKSFALPAVNVIGSNTINAVLETAKNLNAPVIIQFSNGGAQFNAGKGLSNEDQKAAIAGSIAGAKHVHQLAEAYGVPVILHTDHCAKKLLPWIDGLLDKPDTVLKRLNVYHEQTKPLTTFYKGQSDSGLLKFIKVDGSNSVDEVFRAISSQIKI